MEDDSEAGRSSTIVLAALSTGIQGTVSCPGKVVGILPRYLELAMT